MMSTQGVARAAVGLLLLVTLVGTASCEKERSHVAAIDEGAFSKVGETELTHSGVQISYGFPATGILSSVEIPGWSVAQVAKAEVSQLPGIYRQQISMEFAGKAGVYFFVATKYDWSWTLPAGVQHVSLAPGGLPMLQGIEPLRNGILWRIERKEDKTLLYATAYSIVIRYSIDGVSINKAVPANANKINQLEVYYK